MMQKMSKDDAQRLVRAYLDGIERGDCPKVEITDEHTIDMPIGWVFFYQSSRFLEFGDPSDVLAGNAPILVDARDGSLHVTGTGCTVDYYIQNYIDTGDPHVEAVPVLLLSGWREGADKISATRLLNRKTSLGLARSKRCVDDALQRIPTEIRLSDFEEAETLRADLEAIGWDAIVLRKAP